MALQHQNEFHYQQVELLITEPLGIGSYGAVYKAICDDLHCAAKILHPTLFNPSNSGTTRIMRKFEQECHILRMIRHPHIVQYLDTYQDPESRLPVLLMELMDESLTQFLDRSHEPLPYHTEVNLCHDITMALSYLHSNHIIHRDLSSNNVLLIAGSCRAKVTDFGMANLSDVNTDVNSHLTACPGTMAYMPPEAMENPPVYTHKLDSFSFGVLTVQITTRRFPHPGNHFMNINDPTIPYGRVLVPISEIERRRSHIDLIDPAHPLLPVALDCLMNRGRERPSCHELCSRMSTLKASPKYNESVQQSQVNTKPTQSSNTETREREIQQSQQIRDLQQQLQGKEQEIEQQRHQILGLRTLLSTKLKQLAGKDHKVHTHGNQLHNQSDQQQQILTLQNLLTATNERLLTLHQQLTTKDEQLAGKDQQLARKNHQLQRKETIIVAYQKEIHQLRQQLQSSEHVSTNQQRLLDESRCH